MQCTMTCRALEKEGIGYRAVDVSEHGAALEYVTEDLGYSAAPVVVVDQDPQSHWSGFRRDRIKVVGPGSFRGDHVNQGSDDVAVGPP